MITVRQALLRRALILTVAFAALPRTAKAIDLSLHPKLGVRMAITDRSTAADLQPRVWAVANGGESFGGNILVTKNADANGNAWAATGLTTDSGPDAVSWTDGSTQRQRVFFASGGSLRMLRYDNDSQFPLTTIAASPGYDVSATDVAAVTWVSGTTRRIAVVAGAKLGGTPGYTCYWENANLSATWNVSCSTDVRLPANAHDISGAVVDGVVEFYFRDSNQFLSRLRRSGVGTATFLTVLPPGSTIRPSVFVIPSQLPGFFELGVISTANNRVYTGRIGTAATAFLPLWSQKPALPGGATPATGTTATTALAGVQFSGTFGLSYQRTNVYVVSGSRKLFRIGTTTDLGTWASSWGGPYVPRGGQSVFSIGAPTTTTGALLRTPRVFTVAGGSNLFTGSSMTLQEFIEIPIPPFFSTAPTFRDHIRIQTYPEALGSPATESSIGVGPFIGMATSIRRDDPPPWRTMVDDTLDGASEFTGTDLIVQPLPAVNPIGIDASSSDPTCAWAGGKLHYLNLSFDMGADCSAQYYNSTRVVYRRGPSASYIAGLGASSPDLLDLEPPGFFDHPGLAVTENASGVATAEVLYWDVYNTRVRHWKIPATGPAIGPTDIPDTVLKANPAMMLVGANATTYPFTAAAAARFSRSMPIARCDRIT